jgi:hypothetical protein
MITIDRHSERDVITARGWVERKSFVVKIYLSNNPIKRIIARWYWTDERICRLWNKELESQNAKTIQE